MLKDRMTRKAKKVKTERKTAKNARKKELERFC